MWGESSRRRPRRACVAMAPAGTGIGGGIVVDGHLLRGGFGLAGELGHIVVAPGGRRVDAGRAASGGLRERAGADAAVAPPPRAIQRPPGCRSSAPEAIGVMKAPMRRTDRNQTSPNRCCLVG